MRSGIFVQALEPRRMLSANLVADFGGMYPTDSVDINGISYFSANDGVHGRELWRSDGTSSGTRMVQDIVRGGRGSTPLQMTVVGDSMFFFATSKTNEVLLYRSDGTSSSTQMIMNFGVCNQYDKPPVMSTVFKGEFVFAVHRGAADGDEMQLWSSDGTAGGTELLKTLYIDGGASIEWGEFHNLGDRLAVVLLSGLWSTDGTPHGTTTLIREDGQDNNVHVNRQVEYHGRILFINGDELWASDGTADGTGMIMRMHIARSDLMPTDDGFVVVTESDDEDHHLLVATDGTVDGTRILQEIPPLWVSGNGQVVVAGHIVFTAYFQGENSDEGIALWSVDQSTGELVKLVDFPSETSRMTWDFRQIGDVGFFQFVRFKYDEGDIILRQLWSTDGTASGTRMVMDLTADGANPAGPKIDELKQANQPISWPLQDADLHAVQLGEANGMLTIQTPQQTYLLNPATMSIPQGPAQGYSRVDDGVLRIFGTRQDDVLRFYQMGGDANRYVVDINGVKRSFPAEAIQRLIIYGYSGDDRISISESRGIVRLRSRIWSGAGDDTISCGTGRDTVYGEGGDDSIAGGRADDMISGGSDDDSINAGSGDDTATGGEGADNINGGSGNDVIGAGSDDAEDSLNGGSGADVVFGSAVFDIFYTPGNGGDSVADDVLQS